MQSAKRSASASSKESDDPSNVRWLYISDTELWSLQLGDSKDELRSVLVGHVDTKDSTMANQWNLADSWTREKFEFSPANECINDLHASHHWDKGIRVNVNQCREWGMREHFVDLLTNGSDLLLDSLPVFDVSRENYS